MTFDSLLKIISSSIIIGLISTFFKLGEWSQIVSSRYLEQYDNKKELLQDARNNLMSFKEHLLKGIITTLPFITWNITLYIAIQYSSDRLTFLNYISSSGVFIYLFPPLVFILFQSGYLYFATDIKRVSINDQGRIKYDHPVWYSYVILFIGVLIFLMDRFLEPEAKSMLNDYLQVNDEKTIQLSGFFVLCAFISHFLILKPITRDLALIEDYRIIQRTKEIKNDQTSLLGIVGLIFTIIMILIALIITLSIRKDLEFPIGDLINIYCFILLGAVLSGQRSKFIQISKNHFYKNKQLYYRNSKGKQIKVKNRL
ncbi:hypothetical protein J41TS12_43550 [Paenibacillus antibioticophila]|uniref:Uncharacterized protein n=1 Tax=Paenibacillus antibioticophila TaxID=1274374 RepID=A0A919XWU4_9BACL|nr:hypothetical protein [Paenibacillus antibioticophila]GIO39494.1 hypothetical protein J41TS12_43550 [Paenibacillus antibioticophila]